MLLYSKWKAYMLCIGMKGNETMSSKCHVKKEPEMVGMERPVWFRCIVTASDMWKARRQGMPRHAAGIRIREGERRHPPQ